MLRPFVLSPITHIYRGRQNNPFEVRTKNCIKIPTPFVLYPCCDGSFLAVFSIFIPQLKYCKCRLYGLPRLLSLIEASDALVRIDPHNTTVPLATVCKQNMHG